MSRLPGIYENIPNNTYHNDNEWLSSSQIKVALHSAYDYKYFVVDRKGKKEDTQSKSFGSLVHKLILENDTFFEEYFINELTGLDLRRTADKQKLEEQKLLAGSRTLVSQEDYAKALLCYDSVMSHPDAKRFLELPGVSEASIYVELDHTLPSGEVVPFKVRVRPDRLAHGTAILDLKTTKSPSKESFTKDATAPWGYGYDVSAALYVKALAKLTGELLPFIFIAVKNDQPYSTAVYKLSEKSMIAGEAKLSRALTTIVMAERAGKWEFQEEMEEI